MKNLNVFCIDLTKFNNEKLVEVAKNCGVDSEALINNKKSGFVKIYIDKTSGKIIAFTTKKNKEVVYTSALTEMLSSITPITIVKEPVMLTVDGILDKIGKYGIGSLSVNEKAFLDNN